MAAVKHFVHKQGITSGSDLDRVLKPIFGKKYLGTYPIRSSRDVPYLREGELVVLNQNVHWFGAFKKGGKLYESDSYNIDELGKGYIDKKVPRSFIQPPTTADCGQRLCVNLIVALKPKLT